MNTNLIVLKIGGNTASPKNIFRTIDRGSIEEVAKAVRKAMNEGKKFIIVHGGGSHAHTPSRCYGITRRFDRDNIIGLSLTKILLKELSIEISKILLSYNIPVLPLDTCSLIRKSGASIDLDLYVVDEALRCGLTPLLHGDITCIGDRPFIVSSDDLMYVLARDYRPEITVFVIRERGVIDRDGRTIPRLGKRELQYLCEMRDDLYVDVTGGLFKKLDICFRISQICRVYVCPCDSDVLFRVFRGEECSGCTQIISDI
ncbi:MAG: hypothetical protein GXO23_02715 [Crenarchaeota archaeon]|nr:hypothetical protein [Thermoproteota archaeon]